MKLLNCLLVCFVFFLQVCFSQDPGSNVNRIDTIPASGILLNKGWKFQPRDDPKYAQPDYDDSKWEAINPAHDFVTSGYLAILRADIIKAHGGEIEVETNEGEGTSFIINLAMTS
jgi:hypothetical protein